MVTTIGNSSISGAVAMPREPQPAPRQAAPAPKAAPEPVQQPNHQQLQKAVEAVARQIESKAPNSVAFSVDSSNGKAIVKITDAKTGEMIRQIPSEEMVAIARSLDKLQGLLVKGKA
jgi:flagellar protein FlaG